MYQYVVYAYYDNLSGDPAGASLNILAKKAFYTDALVLFDTSRIEASQQSISFDYIWHESVPSKQITKTELYLDDVNLGEIDGNIAEGLFSNRTYTIKSTFKNLENQDETISLTVKTLAKATPVVEINNATPTQESIAFGLTITDTDSIGTITSIELLKAGIAAAQLTNLSEREFTQLLSNTDYQIKITYTYNLNDGMGEQTITKTHDVKTLSKATPSVAVTNVTPTQASVSFVVDITDTDGVGWLTSIELFRGDERVQTAELTARSFTGLLSNSAYSIRLVYTFNSNDGTDNKTIKTQSQLPKNKSKPTPNQLPKNKSKPTPKSTS